MNPALLALAAVALGQALQVRDGLYDPLAVGLLAVAIAAAVTAFIQPIAARFPASVHGVLGAGLLLQFFELFVHRPGSIVAYERGLRASMLLHSSLGAAMVAVLAAVAPDVASPVFVTLTMMLGFGAIGARPSQSAVPALA